VGPARSDLAQRVEVGRLEKLFAELAEARNVIPHAGGALLLAVAPHGAATRTRADHAFTAEDLLAAYYCAFDRETPRHVQLSPEDRRRHTG
jgi:hypothetical protein